MKLRIGALATLLLSAVVFASQPIHFSVSAQAQGVTITQTGGNNTISEAGTTDTFTIKLDAAPTSDVSVSITYLSSDITVNGDTDGTYTVSFTPTDWNTPKVFTLSAVNDRALEVTPNLVLTLSFSSSDTNYDGITAWVDGTSSTNSLNVTIIDNETATLGWSSSSASAPEGTNSSPQVQLDVTADPAGGTPTLEGTISYTVNIIYGTAEAADFGVTSGTLSFANVSDLATNTVIIPHLDDALVEGSETYTVGIAVNPPVASVSVGSNFSGTITDGDSATVALSGSATVSEGVGTHNVMITLTTNGTSTLEQALTIPVNLVDNTAVYSGTSGDMYFTGPVNTLNVVFPANAGNGATQNAAITINNDRTVEASTLSSPGFNVVENFNVSIGAIAGPATVTTSSITVSIDENDYAYITMNPTFTVNDPSDLESNTNRTANVQVRIVSNGTGTVQVQDAFSVPIGSYALGQPNDAAPGSDFVAVSTTVNFPALSGDNSQQAVPLTIINDSIDEYYGALNSFNQNREFFDVGFGTTALRAAYAGVPLLIPSSANDNCNGTGGLPNLSGSCRDRRTVIILDNDEAGVTVTETAGSTAVTEGGAGDSYTLVLNTQPTSNVSIVLAFDPTQVSLNGDTDGSLTVTFTTTNWNTAQTVSVAAVNDSSVEQNPHTSLITQTIASSDTIYNAINPADVTVSITDNDTATITLVSASSSAAETTSSHSLTARLDMVINGIPGGTLGSALTANVNVTLGTAEISDFSQTTTQVTFAAGSANSATSFINFTVVNDRLLEGSDTFTVTLSLASGNGTVSGAHVVTITDDESGSITFTDASSTVSEGTIPHNVGAQLVISGSGSGNLQLESAVSVVINQRPGTASTPADYTLTTPSLSFLSGISSPISLSIASSIASDMVVESDETFSLSFGAVTSSGTISASGTHTVTITNITTASINITPTTFSTSEGVAGTLVSFTLGSQPLNDVTITLTPNAQVTTNINTLTFNSTNWNVAQTVTVTAVDDFTAEGTHAGSISFSVSGAVGYAGQSVSPLRVTIADNDTSGVTVTQTDGVTALAEGSTTDTFTIVLTSQPAFDVTIALTGTQVTLFPASLVFTSADWNIAQTVTVTAVDDNISEGLHTGSITFVFSGDSSYSGLNLSALTPTISDNDGAGIAISQLSFQLTEGLSGAYEIRLLSAPTSPIDLRVEFPADQLSVNGNSAPFVLSFSSDAPQTINFRVLENPDLNSTRSLTITHTVTGSSVPAYPNGTTVTVDLQIIDFSPPPPVPLCEDHNFDEGGVVRSSTTDALGYAINCRVLYQNGGPTTWLGGPLYSEANLGVPGLIELGVQQAIDIFSPPGMTYFEGGAVFCLRGQGTLIWLAARNSPRRPEIIGSYQVDDFPGFTCATLFEPGTLVLVSENPLDE